MFFKDLTSTIIKNDDMARLEEEIPVILCKLERIFPPSFFDSMEHLPIHLLMKRDLLGQCNIGGCILSKGNSFLL